MSRALLTLRTIADRDRACRWVRQAPIGSRVEFKAPRRSTEQNSMMWGLLTEIATQKTHCGRKYTPDQWKVIFLHAMGREVQFIPTLDKSTFIPWGCSSSDLSKKEMTDLIEFILAWGSENGVDFQDYQSERYAERTQEASVV